MKNSLLILLKIYRFEELNIKIYSFVANSDVKKMNKNSGHFLEFEIGSLFFFGLISFE